MFKNLKIGQKLVVILLVISVVPLVASSFWNYAYTKTALEKKTINALQAVNDSRAAHIKHLVQIRQEQAKAFAGAFLPRQLRESGLNSPEIIKGIQKDIDSALNDLNFPPTGNYEYIDKKTDIEIIGVWDVHGNIIASTDRALIGLKMPIEYLQNVYKQGTYFGGLEKDPLTGKNFLMHLEEIRNVTSDLIVGAISLKIRARILDEITTARAGLGESGETYIVDNKYRMITQSRFIKDSILNVRVMTDGVTSCFKGEKAPTIYKNYRGVEVLGVQKYLPDEDWCLVAEIDSSEALAPVRTFRNRTFTVSGILILFILIFAYVASRSFTKPIVRLHEMSQEVAKGNYETEVVVDSKDEIGSLTKAFNDMTKSLAKATAELEAKSQVLFKHLAISTQQKKELKEVNQELDSFVYTASHDLRAPLRGIASFATFLEEDYKEKLDDQGKDYINEIRKGAGKMNTLIEDLLTLSRISRIKNPYELIDIRKLIDSVLERIKFDIKDKKVELIIQKNLPTIVCDRIKMEEVFLNLINNGIKFSSKNSKEAHPIIRITYTEEDKSHKFCVKDNGIGIDPKYHSQVFGIFKRLHTDQEYEGTGAGLSIIKRVVDDHQGKIWIDSKLGEGAAFIFTISKELKIGSSEENASEDESLSAEGDQTDNKKDS